MLFWENECGIMPSAGSEFGDSGKKFIRLNLACPTKTIESALEKMKKGFDRFF